MYSLISVLVALALALSGALSTAVATTASVAAPATLSDPSSDTSAPAIDIVRSGVANSGRGIAYTLTFRGVAAAASSSLHICIDRENASDMICVAPGQQTVTRGSQLLPAHITRIHHQLRIWIRAADLSYAPGSIVRASFVLSQDTCTGASCTERTGTVQATYIADPGCKAASGLYTNGSRSVPAVALTFDDGPGPQTAQILATLHELHAPATFYINGVRTDSHGKRMLRLMRAQGNEIGNHSWRHEQFPQTDSLRRVNAIVRQTTGQSPCTFRPPYGATNSALIARAGALGMATVTWNVDPRDWSLPGTAHIISEASRGTSGSIVIMHDGPAGRQQTAAAVRQVILNYRRRGYQLVTVDELLGFVAR